MSAPHRHLGVKELAELIGVSRPRLYKIMVTYKHDFPEPAARLAKGPVWHLADVERWLNVHWDRPAGYRLDRRRP